MTKRRYHFKRKAMTVPEIDRMVSRSRVDPSVLGSLSGRSVPTPVVDSILASLRASGAVGAASADTRSAARGGIPPTVKRGEQGKAVDEPAPEYEELVLADGKVKAVLKRRRHADDSAFIDWVHFSFSSESWKLWDCGTPVTDEDVVLLLSYQLERIFGFGVTSKRDRGMNFYRETYVLGDKLGFVSIGGQRGTVLVQVTGEGCAAAKFGWEMRLQQWLEMHMEAGGDADRYRPKLTRCDVARDFFHGEYTPERASAEYDEGLFRLPKSPTDPYCEQRGCWKRQNKKGRTFTAGVRGSGKYARIYEKGRQLGAPDSEWVRVEVEFKAVDRVLPFDMLTRPGAYLSGAYPAFEHMAPVQDRIRTIRQTARCTKEWKEAWIRRQCGKDLFALVQLEEGETDQERAFNLVRRLSVEECPRWAGVPVTFQEISPIHVTVTENNTLHVLGAHLGVGTFAHPSEVNHAIHC